MRKQAFLSEWQISSKDTSSGLNPFRSSRTCLRAQTVLVRDQAGALLRAASRVRRWTAPRPQAGRPRQLTSVVCGSALVVPSHLHNRIDHRRFRASVEDLGRERRRRLTTPSSRAREGADASLTGSRVGVVVRCRGLNAHVVVCIVLPREFACR
jgi:hypothetical protein